MPITETSQRLYFHRTDSSDLYLLPDTIIYSAPPYHIASEELSEPEIHERPLHASTPQQQIDFEHLDYEEMKREILQRGERLRDIGELAINYEEDF